MQPKIQLDIRPADEEDVVSSEETTKIDVQDVNFFYGKKQALFNTTLAIRANQVTAFIGPSGCGKSTFLRCINRMNDTIAGTRAEGKILLDGVNVLESKDGCRRAPAHGRHGVPTTEPVPDVDPRQRVIWP